MLLDVWQTNGLSGGWMTSWSRHLRPVGEGANTQTLLTYFTLAPRPYHEIIMNKRDETQNMWGFG